MGGNVEINDVHPSARLAPDVQLGEKCVIGPDVTIGPGTKIGNRVTIVGHTTIGSGNIIDDDCILGVVPQDLKYRGAPALLVIGHNNKLHRMVTMHIGTEPGGFVTRVGNGNVFEEGAHVAHDCFVDDNTRIGKNVQLAGHILVQSGAVLEELVGLHHFVTFGKYARVTTHTPVRRDVPPYTIFGYDTPDASQPSVNGINEAGIKAAKLSADEEADLRRALSELFEDETALQTKLEQLENMGVEGEVAFLCEFCQQSLAGKFGRYREGYRGQIPPEAAEILPPEKIAELERILSNWK